jgi:chemotaxis response regulator CheB
MLTSVLVADDSEIMRCAICKTLKEEPGINVVGESENFAETVQKVGYLKPDVLLIDFHMMKESDLPPASVKARLKSVCTVGISISNDQNTKAIADSYGAVALLDKMTLYTEMVPAILRCTHVAC